MTPPSCGFLLLHVVSLLMSLLGIVPAATVAGTKDSVSTLEDSMSFIQSHIRTDSDESTGVTFQSIVDQGLRLYNEAAPSAKQNLNRSLSQLLSGLQDLLDSEDTIRLIEAASDAFWQQDGARHDKLIKGFTDVLAEVGTDYDAVVKSFMNGSAFEHLEGKPVMDDMLNSAQEVHAALAKDGSLQFLEAAKRKVRSLSGNLVAQLLELQTQANPVDPRNTAAYLVGGPLIGAFMGLLETQGVAWDSTMDSLIGRKCTVMRDQKDKCFWPKVVFGMILGQCLGGVMWGSWYEADKYPGSTFKRFMDGSSRGAAVGITINLFIDLLLQAKRSTSKHKFAWPSAMRGDLIRTGKYNDYEKDSRADDRLDLFNLITWLTPALFWGFIAAAQEKTKPS